MTSRSDLMVIAAVATITICWQNAMAALAFVWGLIHGVGIEAFLAFLPAVVGSAEE